MAEGRGRGRGRRKKASVLADDITPTDQDGVETYVTSVRKRQVKVELVDVGADVRADLSPVKRSSTATPGLGTTSRLIQGDQEDHQAFVHDSSRDSPQASISQRIAEVTGNVVDTIASGVPAAAEFVTRTQLGWALGSLIATMLLLSLLASRLAQPHVTQNQLKTLVRDIEEADRQYQQLLNKLDSTQRLQHHTEERVEKVMARLRSLEKEWAALESLKKGQVAGDTDLTLDGLSPEIFRRIDENSQGRPDYAAHASGGKVVGHSQLFHAVDKPWWYILRDVADDWFPSLPAPVHPKADKWLLSPGGVAGECLPFNGTSGWVDVRLRTAIWPQAVTIEHIPQSLSFEPRSAPRSCTIWGWSSSRRLNNGQVERLKEHNWRKQRIGSFVFEQTKGSLQTFTLANDLAVDHIRFEVNSNHGQPAYTCVYRIRIHGSPLAGADYANS